MKKIIRLLTVILLIISFSLCFTGCGNKINLQNEGAKVNYNNIYGYFPQQNIWIDKNSVYYSRSLLVDGYYYSDQNGKTKITSDFMINKQTDKSDIIISSYMQAFGDDVYFWCDNYKNESKDSMTGSAFLYHYSKADETFEELIETDDHFMEWTVFNGYVIYKSFADENYSFYNLKCVDLESKEVATISDEVVSFGIANEELRYVKKGNGEYSCGLYGFDLAKKRDYLISDFDGKLGENVNYNYTEDKLIYFDSQNLKILNIVSNKTEKFELPGYINYISSYNDFAFVSTESYIYYVDLNSGEYKELYNHNGDLMLINAINDESAVFVNYENQESLIGSKVIVYQINSDGTVKKLFKG